MCRKGALCKYRHDTSLIKVCRQYLRGNCYNRNCLFNHNLTEFNTPLCRYFLENKCSNSNCNFLHHKPLNYDDLNYDIWICRPFAIGGWCPRGKKCLFMHEWNCPDFEEDGFCPRGKSCTLAHPITKRTQELMLNLKKYVRTENEVDEVFVDSDEKKRVVQSSYTVDPQALFDKPTLDGKYEAYIDVESTGDMNTFRENSQFLIMDSSEESSDDEPSDTLQKNDDYVDFV